MTGFRRSFAVCWMPTSDRCSLQRNGARWLLIEAGRDTRGDIAFTSRLLPSLPVDAVGFPCGATRSMRASIDPWSRQPAIASVGCAPTAHTSVSCEAATWLRITGRHWISDPRRARYDWREDRPARRPSVRRSLPVRSNGVSTRPHFDSLAGRRRILSLPERPANRRSSRIHPTSARPSAGHRAQRRVFRQDRGLSRRNDHESRDRPCPGIARGRVRATCAGLCRYRPLLPAAAEHRPREDGQWNAFLASPPRGESVSRVIVSRRR